MKYRSLAGMKVSVYAAGCDSFGLSRDLDRTFEFLDAYADAGGNFLDSARVYGGEPGTSEKYIGKWLRSRGCRDRVIIGTKGAHPYFDSMHSGRLDKESVRYDLENSLENLSVDHIDIYWLHRDDPSLPVSEIIENLNVFVKAGEVRALGASNWSPRRIEEANLYAAEHDLAGFAANQPQFSLAVQHFCPDDTMFSMDGEAYEFHKRSALPCVCYSPAAKGFFAKLEKYGVDGLPAGLKSWFLCPENLEIYERLKCLSEQTGLDIPTLCLCYLTAQPFDVFPVVGASSIGMLNGILKSADIEITKEQSDFLRKI